jgi:nicotinamidase-related amidase
MKQEYARIARHRCEMSGHQVSPAQATKILSVKRCHWSQSPLLLGLYDRLGSKPLRHGKLFMADRDEDAANINGRAPGGVGLLIIDMINNMAFEGAEQMRPSAEASADIILRLRREADRLETPVIYVNDNYGHWHSDKSRLVAAFSEGNCPGRELVKRIAPREDDYFVIKPQISGFYATNLPVLLPKLGVSRLVLTGIAADICVLFTAADAHMRAYDLWVPSDAVACEESRRKDWALDIMRKSMGADTRTTDELALETWIRNAFD